jgi:hypothetical protein
LIVVLVVLLMPSATTTTMKSNNFGFKQECSLWGDPARWGAALTPWTAPSEVPRTTLAAGKAPRRRSSRRCSAPCRQKFHRRGCSHREPLAPLMQVSSLTGTTLGCCIGQLRQNGALAPSAWVWDLSVLFFYRFRGALRLRWPLRPGAVIAALDSARSWSSARRWTRHAMAPASLHVCGVRLAARWRPWQSNLWFPRPRPLVLCVISARGPE